MKMHKCDTNPIVGVPQVVELGDLPNEVTDKSIRPTQEFEGQNKSIKSRMWYLLWKHKMLKMSTREQCQERTRPKEKTGKKHDMGYFCSGVACLQTYYEEEKKLSISRDSAESAISDVKKS
ncbi:hypothetical protein ACFX1X_019416 [Malus domestica]